MKTVLTGITRNYSNEDGELEVMENLRHDGATLRPIGDVERMEFYQDGEKIEKPEDIVFVHVFNDRRFWFSYAEGWLKVYGEQEGELRVNVNPTKVLECEKPTQIISMGTIVIVNNKTYSSYLDNTDGVYNIIKFDALDDIKIIIQQSQEKFFTDEYRSSLTNVWEESSISAINQYLEKYNSFCGEGGVSYFGKAKKEAEENGFATNVLLLRYGFKMFDGSYLKLSPIRVFAPQYTWESGSFIESCVSLAVSRQSTTENYYYKVYGIVTGLNLSARVQADISKFDSVLLKYIDSLDFFISEVPLYDGEEQTSPIKISGKETTAGSFFHLQGSCLPFKKDGLAERIGDASIYYKVASLKLKSFKSDNFIDLTKDILNIEQQDYLKEFTRSSFSSKGKSFIYNNSLHLFNIEYDAIEGILDNYEDLEEGELSKTKITLTGPDLKGYTKYGKYFDDISPILVFPDSYRSVMFESIYQYTNGEKDFRRDSFALEDNILSNTSTHLIKEDIESVCAKFKWTTSGGTIENAVKNRKTFQIPSVYTLSKVDDFEFSQYETYKKLIRDPNKMKVSSPNNPFYFPIEQTYQIGQGEIKDLAVVSTALSQGQFGQFPLYVFCSDGVYAMNVGTDTAYTNVAPVSRDVITGDIISIDKAVVFISDRGLKIMQGDKATDVSLVMQSNAYEQLQGETFEDFIKDAKLAYNYFFGEIYLLREGKEFAFVYELKNQTWATRKIDFKGKLDVYPDLYIQSEEGVYKLSREIYPPDGTQKVKLKTRPMKWGDGFKKVARMIIRGLVIGNWDIKILASNDGVNFHKLRNVNIDTNIPKRDIPFRRISGSFKFYVLEIEADMDERAYIEFIETELQESIFNKRIR